MAIMISESYKKSCFNTLIIICDKSRYSISVVGYGQVRYEQV